MNHYQREVRKTRLAVTLFWSAVVGFLMGGGILLIAAVLR